MATVLDRVPLEDIQTRAREIQFSRTALTLLMLPFVVVGWLARKAWLGVAFAAAAVQVGWHLATPTPPRPDGGGG